MLGGIRVLGKSGSYLAATAWAAAMLACANVCEPEGVAPGGKGGGGPGGRGGALPDWNPFAAGGLGFSQLGGPVGAGGKGAAEAYAKIM